MANAHDVAAYIISSCGPMTAMKLEKLAYYAQAWSLVWDEKPIFPERIEAWANGPVVRELYDLHRGQFQVQDWPQGYPGKLTDQETETLNAMLAFYGDKSSQWLSDLTHLENPWMHARSGLSPADRGEREITHAAMHEYYSSL